MVKRSTFRPIEAEPEPAGIEAAGSSIASPPTSQADGGADHLDWIDPGPEEAGGIPQPGPPPEPEPAAPVVLDRDQFWELFRGCFAMSSSLAAVVPIGGKRAPIASLAIAPEEEPAARAASDALYDTAEEVPSLRWLIEPGNVWVQRAVVCLAFAAPKAAAVSAELQARRAAPAPRAMEAAAAKPAAGPVIPPDIMAGFAGQA
jgi:hypothetical protein